MATALNESAWSTTAASNDGADSTIGTVANTSSPTSVDDWIRGIMASRAKARLDQGGGLVAGGSSTALTVTTNQNLSSSHIANGLRLCVRTASAATGAATIAVDGLTAVTILKNNGAAIASGDWASGAILDLVYSSTATAFIAANLDVANASLAPSSRASFSAHKNGTDQTITTLTAKVTFGTEVFDVGGYFSSSTWTPPAGTAMLTVCLNWNDIPDATACYVHIYKNGAEYKSVLFGMYGSNTGRSFSIVDQCNGSDTYEVYAQSSDASYRIMGGATRTFFMGTMI